MYKTTISLTIAFALAFAGAQVVHARGFGGAHASSYSAGGYHSGSSYHEGGYHSGSGYHEGGASGEVYHGAGGTTVAHESAGVHGAAVGPGGAAAGGKTESATAVKGPEGNTYTHESSAGHGVAAGPDGVEGSRYASSSSAFHGAEGGSYAHRAAGYGTAHVALPTDAGFGVPAARTGAGVYAGHHQTEAINGSVYAARGTAVRTSYNGAGMYGHAWYGAHPNAWAPAGWTAGRAWGTPTWPAVGTSLGWGSVQPIYYNYGTNITYQNDQVCYNDQPVATAEEYYQQASALAEAPPPPAATSADWTSLGVFALVQNDKSDPHFVIQLAINKSGAIAGNYSDVVSGTAAPVHGAVDKKTQRVAWIVGDNKNTVGETGLYNLTKDEAPALIHIGKDKTQQWLLVRLKQPDEAAGEK